MAEISRRALLSRTALVAGLVAGAGLGLTRRVHHRVAVVPPAPPAALTDALTRQRRLLASYHSVAGGPARPALVGLRSDVAAHGDALRALLELYPGWRLAEAAGTPAPGPSTGGPSAPAPSADGPSGGTPSRGGTPAASPAGLAAASTADAQTLSAAVLAWPAGEPHAGEVVPVLASMAACLTSHAQVLA